MLTVNVPTVPLSTSVNSVFGEPFESFIVNVPLAFAAPKVTIGVVLLNVSGEAPDNVTVPEAAIDVAPAIAPGCVIQPVV